MSSSGQQRHFECSASPLEVAPSASEMMVEIGLVVALHLAFALAVVLSLNAFGGA